MANAEDMAGADRPGAGARSSRPGSAPDDTAAFQRFYLAGAEEAHRGPLYRLCVGWWRGHRSRRGR